VVRVPVDVLGASSKISTVNACSAFRLIRPIMVHLFYKFFQSENDRTQPKQRKLGLKDWSLVLSPDMPQQNPGSNVCSLFTIAGCDIIT